MRVLRAKTSVCDFKRYTSDKYIKKCWIVVKIQSKYVALHVALFWGIGTFIIKNEDTIKIKLDEKIMYEQLKLKIMTDDDFIKNKIKFIQMFIRQRKLKVEFEIINLENNLATKELE